MPFRKDEIISEIRNLIKTIEKNGISISAAYLFGSYAKGKANEWSDIDVALVSDNFSGIRFYDVEKLINAQNNPGSNLFVKEISENSIRIK